MQKPKRKSEQQTFYYETDRKPKKVAATLEKFWRRQQKQQNLNLDKITIKAITTDELWHIETDRSDVYYTYMDADIRGEIFLENGKTIMKLSVSIIPVKIKYNDSIFAVPVKYKLISAVFLIAFAIIEPAGALIICVLFAAFFALLKLSEQSKANALQKCQKIIELLENFAIEEEEKLEAEWERLYGKTKNEELSPETLKEKRK